jgi:hypothetical protein
MRRMAFRTMVGVFALGLAACGGEPTESEAQDEPLALAEASEDIELGDGSTADATSAAAEGADEATVAAATPALASAGGDLTAYVGMFPFDAVGGVTWHDHPMVTAGIRKTVIDAAVRRAMQSPGGPSAPIATYQGKVGSWGCQQHNCGDHQWAVLVDPKTGATDVCYHNAEQTGEASRWFLAGGGQETRPGNCSVV